MKSDTQIKILVVDDDLKLCKLLRQYLDKQGFSVNCAEDGVSMDTYLSKSSVDLIILDLMLPAENGLSIIKRLHSTSTTPVIMLSASGEDIDRIIGLEMGADDYLAKPFNPRELLARIRSVLRRQQSPLSLPSKKKSALYRFGPYQFNTANQMLLCNGKPVTLTSGELSLLEIFIANPKQVLSRDTLLEKLKGYDCAPFDRSIDVRIMRLRQKIEPDTSAPIYIQTVWGEGYKFIPGEVSA
ncbi:MAG: response regulator [Methyloprofundus sp.]|nr:response regulator [Methyloprofundus sp.]MDT8426204.1 response regulator [Methyloprofundus sp.]